MFEGFCFDTEMIEEFAFNQSSRPKLYWNGLNFFGTKWADYVRLWSGTKNSWSAQTISKNRRPNGWYWHTLRSGPPSLKTKIGPTAHPSPPGRASSAPHAVTGRLLAQIGVAAPAAEMAIRYYWPMVAAAVGFRLVLVLFGGDLHLASRPEVSTPLTSLRRRKRLLTSPTSS